MRMVACVWTHEGKGEKKELTGWGKWWMQRADANECKKKEKKKKNLLGMGACRRECIACR